MLIINAYELLFKTKIVDDTKKLRSIYVYEKKKLLDSFSSKREYIKKIESECIKNNIEIITSTPTFEIWYLIHYGNKGLSFSTSKEVKKLQKKLKQPYSETTVMYRLIKDFTNKSRSTAECFEKNEIEESILK